MSWSGRILLVEDEALMQELLMFELEDAGFTVVCCLDGVAALKALEQEEAFVALVTDVNLGSRVNGGEVAEAARARFPQISILFMTGDSQQEWRRRGLAGSEILCKPFMPANVVRAVSTMLAP